MSEHSLFSLLCINSLVFSYFLDTSLIAVPYIIIFVFEFIAKATPVDRYHSKCLLAKRICENGCTDYKVKKPHDILLAL